MEELNQLFRVLHSKARDDLRKLGCNSQIFKDIYQDAFFILIKKLKDSTSDGKTTPGYIIQVCKYLWYKERKKQGIHEQIEGKDFIDEIEAGSREAMLDLQAKHMKNLSAICQEILTLYSLNYSEEKISRVLNLEGPKAVNNHKHFCKEKLRGMIKNDPTYKEING